ncbi:MAG TPA: hypothetical protein PK006_04420 [Saprospiraceae bacterium]|nr:hypothetical protein [Saprospiraceae bacterium]
MRWIILACLFYHSNPLLSQFKISFSFDSIRINGWPGVHSFAYAQRDSEIIIIGGRIDGIHPKESGFERSNANDKIFIWNTESMKVESFELKLTSPELKNFFTAANHLFIQKDSLFYLMGGYGQASDSSYLSYDYLAQINLRAFIDLIKQNKSADESIQWIRNPLFANAGGKLMKLHSEFVIVGGHRFMGKYSSNSSKINQSYFNKALFFSIPASPILQVEIRDSILDEFNFHRRDYNTAYFGRGNDKKIIVFSGVFQVNEEKAFTNLALLGPKGYTDISTPQYFSNYHCAHTGFIDSTNTQYHVFFGGMSEQYKDSLGLLKTDYLVPFVNHVSMISIDSTAQCNEYMLSEILPGDFGATAEFVISDHVALRDGLIDCSSLTANDKTIGYIFGGLWNKSGNRNPWKNDLAHLVSANPFFIKVKARLAKDVSVINPTSKPKSLYSITVSDQQLELMSELGEEKQLYYRIQDYQGRSIQKGKINLGYNQKAQIEMATAFPSGQYRCLLLNEQHHIIANLAFQIIH